MRNRSARRKPPAPRRGSPSQIDPTRTATMRRQFDAELARRAAALKGRLYALVVTEDAFGLAPRTDPFTGNSLTTNAGRWAGDPEDEQLRKFADWLRVTLDESGGLSDDALWEKFIDQGYRKGAGRSYDEWLKAGGSEPEAIAQLTGAGKEAYLRTALSHPVSKSRLTALIRRTGAELEGTTQVLATSITRSLADSLTRGLSPREAAKQMAKDVGTGLEKARLIARTELIRAHAEGQLDSLERLGVAEVGAAVEWASAGDGRVCKKCEGINGLVFSISDARGLLPLHPRCRCAWLPAFGTPTGMRDQVTVLRAKRKLVANLETRDEWVSALADLLGGLLGETALDLFPVGPVENRFNPLQPRDANGRFAKTAGTATPWHSLKESRYATASAAVKAVKAGDRSPESLAALKYSLDSLTVDQLRGLSKEHGIGIPPRGLKAALVERINGEVSTRPVPPPPAPRVTVPPPVLPPPAVTRVDYQHKDPNHPLVKAMLTENPELTRKVAEFHEWAKAQEVKERVFVEARDRFRDITNQLQDARAKNRPWSEIDRLEEANDEARKIYSAAANARGEATGEARTRMLETFGLPDADRLRVISAPMEGEPRTWGAYSAQAFRPTQNQAKNIAEAEDFVRRLTLNQVPLSVVHAESGTGRAFQAADFKSLSGRKIIAHGHEMKNSGTNPGIVDTDAKAVGVHELAHALENVKPRVQYLANEFKTYRLAGETPQQLSKLFPNGKYEPDEVGAKDQFDRVFSGSSAYYVGKSYGYARDTEILSMGMEKLYRDPAGFAAKDPEYFHFLMYAIQGKH